ncbi:MAG TPA: thioredoxin-like domain-containing protein [Lacipirellulaceae bacterium]|nr:thioredoxin-like domain-containing protein [Lacipirellulaceae bacterium]
MATTYVGMRCRGKRRHLVGRNLSILVAAVVISCAGCGQGGGINTGAQAQSLGTSASDASAALNPYPRRISAPPLKGAEWVNTPAPLSLADFHGRFVLLDFWTFCCINCMHILPELKKLEHAFPNELVVIGIHSAKFSGERVTDNIREAVLRYEIEHPVVNDAKMMIWNRYGAQSWPTLVLIDPLGDVVWAASGERSFEDIKAVIDRGLPYYRSKGLLKPGPRPTIIGANKQPATPLKFPGKVLADEAGRRLFIADSNHNRIIIATLDGQLQQVIGSGVIGRNDGGFETCSFNHPQGMALVDSTLYIADTENHLIRKADLTSRRVTTVAGTGEKGNAWSELGIVGGNASDQNGTGGRRSPKSTSLSNPWALWAHGKNLYIAMAGMHQIWKMSLDESEIGPYAGNAREDIVDGPLFSAAAYDPHVASFAQPSGLSSDGKRLFVADSEGSTVRSVPFDPNGKVETLVGLTGTLFDFGDVDGTGRNIRLQHPLGVAWWGGKLYVADTYNNKIKVMDVQRRTCHALAGTGQPGNSDADNGKAATFNEPGGISAAAGKLFVADTNNHTIRVVESVAPFRVTTLEIRGLSAPSSRP